MLHDLQPYVCTYEHCDQGDKLFASRTEWIQHELWSHRKIWQCTAEGCPLGEIEFPTKAMYKAHLRSLHHNSLSEDIHGGPQLEAFCKMAEGITRNLRAMCPICHGTHVSQEALQKHIGYHLERLAFFALPKDAQEDTEDLEEGGSLHGQERSNEDDDSTLLSWGSSKRLSERSQDATDKIERPDIESTSSPNLGSSSASAKGDTQEPNSFNHHITGQGDTDFWTKLESPQILDSIRQHGWMAVKGASGPAASEIEGEPVTVFEDLASMKQVDASCVAFSPSGRVLGIGSDSRIYLAHMDANGAFIASDRVPRYQEIHTTTRTVFPKGRSYAPGKNSLGGASCHSICFSTDDAFMFIAWDSPGAARSSKYEDLPNHPRDLHCIWVRGPTSFG